MDKYSGIAMLSCMERRSGGGCGSDRRRSCRNTDSAFSGTGREKMRGSRSGSNRIRADKEYDGKSDFPTWSDLRETDADGRTRYGTAVCRCQSGGDRAVSDPDPEIWDRMRMGNLWGVFVWN